MDTFLSFLAFAVAMYGAYRLYLHLEERKAQKKRVSGTPSGTNKNSRIK